MVRFYQDNSMLMNCGTSLCRRLVKEGKKVYLFYDTDIPALARMYRSMGFDTIGSWVVAAITQERVPHLEVGL